MKGWGITRSRLENRKPGQHGLDLSYKSLSREEEDIMGTKLLPSSDAASTNVIIGFNRSNLNKRRAWLQEQARMMQEISADVAVGYSFKQEEKRKCLR